jgi:hypothetical protein
VSPWWGVAIGFAACLAVVAVAGWWPARLCGVVYRLCYRQPRVGCNLAKKVWVNRAALQ